MCSSRKNPNPPQGRSLEIPRGSGGVLKAKFLEAMYQNKVEFPEGRGVQNKKPSVGGVWTFSGTAQCSRSLRKRTKGHILHYDWWIWIHLVGFCFLWSIDC